MIRTMTRVPSRLFVPLALTLAVTVIPPRPAVAAEAVDPIWGLVTVLIRATAPDGPLDESSAAERVELESLRPDAADIRTLLDSAIVVTQQTVQVPAAPQPTYVPQYRYATPAPAGGYQTVQNTVNAAVTYWTGQPQQQVTYAQPMATQPVATQPAAAQPAAPSYGDPYGFTAWLNGVRAQYGLGAVSYDANLSAWANMNNAQQNSHGLGHHVMGPARRQNSAMGSAGSIGSQWLASPPHAAALLDPSIRVIGIAGMGAYWTFNAY
jgi:uncharacterized protein YkwD